MNNMLLLQKLSIEQAKLMQLVNDYPVSFFSLLKRNNNYQGLYEYVLTNTQFLPKEANVSVRVYCILHNIQEMPKCKHCNKTLTLKTFRGIQKGFAEYCNNKCSNNSLTKKEMLKNIFLEKYGTTSPLNNKKLREKGKKTKLERYGNENFVNNEKAKQTCLEKYGVNNPAKNKKVIEKAKQTMLKRYGVENSMYHEELKQKQLQSSIAHFGKDNINNRKKAAETYKSHTKQQAEDIKKRTIATNIERYGVENPMQVKEIQAKIKKTKLENHNDPNYNNRDKAKQTCLEKYGVTSWSKTELFKQQLKKCNTERMQKQYATKKQNNTFAFSKVELNVFQLLKSKFANIERQYKSDKYPFKCDFYIPEEDLYIEFNGTWTHGKHPFDPNNIDDQLQLEKLKEKAKTSNYYKSAIKTWTITDPIKRKTAKDNNLNFIELWNITDVKKFVKVNNI